VLKYITVFPAILSNLRMIGNNLEMNYAGIFKKTFYSAKEFLKFSGDNQFFKLIPS
jgi:hypothetical protein